MSKKKKIRQREKVASHYTGGRGNGTAEQSMETETTAAVVYNRKSKFSPKIRDIGSISSSQFLLQQTKFWFTIYVNHCGHINYFIAQNEAAE